MRWLEILEEFLIMALMALMTVVSFVQVIARYVFNYSFVWALEVTGVMFAWLIFIGMSYGVRVHAHIGVDALVKVLGGTAARVMATLAAVLCIAYSAILVWGSTQYVLKMYDVGILMQDIPIQQWIPRAVMPVGFALLGFRFLQVLWRALRGEEVQMLGDEAKEALQLRQDVEHEGAAQ
ncbi:MAG: TRAP transporter small permease [Ramlibacter sp.]